MKTNSITTNNFIQHTIKYYFVFCPRYRRKIFDITGVQQRFIDLIRLYCVEQKLIASSIDFYSDTVIIQLTSNPTLSPNDIVNGIKKLTSRVLREEFPALSSMTSLWTRNYLVSTTPLTQNTITAFVSMQKKRL